ncbi:MAG: hypothetical protein JSW73_02060 [Candidatus Woesearchaeota archaeon]|nr:MAG: hypothetical protein JSW73_02060 [Candidatus Woesearchaeota archaeon]
MVTKEKLQERAKKVEELSDKFNEADLATGKTPEEIVNDLYAPLENG